jgi:predicted PurR-regulated permease PerM
MSDRIARERVSALLFYGTLALLAYFIYLLFRPFLVPLAWAAIVAAVFHPFHSRLAARWGDPWASALSTFVVTVVIIAPILVVMTLFVEEASQAISSVDLSLRSPAFTRIEAVWARLQARLFGRNVSDLNDLVREASTWAAALIAGQAGVLLRNLVVFLFDLVVMLFAVFFFFRDGLAMVAGLRRVLPFRTEFSDMMIAQANELIQASVIAGLIVAAVQGALGGITFAILGLNAPVFWGVVMAFFALLPVAGAWVIWVPAAVWLLVSGSIGRGIALIIVGTFVVGLVDNVLRPALVSGRTQLNGLLIFVSLLGGVGAFGLIGLVLGPVVIATAIGLLEAYAVNRREGDRRPPDGVVRV